MPSAKAAIVALTLLAASGSGASAGIVSTWPLLAFDRQTDCELQIAGNGRFLELRAAGLVPGEALHLDIANSDMTPIAADVYADRHGGWSKLYIPFRFGADGGTVQVRLDASRCTLSASVPWQREVRTIP